MEKYALNIIACGVVVWTLTYLFVWKIFRKWSFELHSGLVYIIYAMVEITFCSLSVQDWSCPLCSMASKISPAQMEAVAVAISYLIYDSICLQLNNRFSVDRVLHHLISIAGLGAGLEYHTCGSHLVGALLITEISGPFRRLRELLKELGYKDTNLSLAADFLYAVIFFFTRMVGGPYLFYMALTFDGCSNLVFKVMGCGLQLLSAFLFYKVVKMVNYSLTRRARATSKQDVSNGKLD